MKKLSIIVPIYNVEKYVRECIDSIINQAYTNLEIILIDDGSEDSCGEICDEYAKKDARIVALHQKNAGLSAARNLGVSAARGEYIGFVDGDDYIHTDMYKEMMLMAEKHNADIVECQRINFIDEETPEGIQITRGYKLLSGKEALGQLISLEKKAGFPVYAVWDKIFKKELLENEEFPMGYIHEEYFYDAKIFLKAKRYIILSDKLYFHRERQNSITTSKFSEKDLDKLKLISQRTNFLIEKGEEKLAKYSKIEYFYVELNYYAKAMESNNFAIANLAREELNDNKKEILGWNLSIIRRFDILLFYLSDKLYYAWYKIKTKLWK